MSELPAGWEKKVSKTHGKEYYYNAQVGDTWIKSLLLIALHPKTDLCQSCSHAAEQFMHAEQFWAKTSVTRVKQTII